MVDSYALKAAAFLAQVLDLGDDPAILATGVVSLKREAGSGVSTIELESSVGPAAFLIYDYQIATLEIVGAGGRAQFEADLKTLERAAELDTPGPRILAHAVTGDEAYILATTPAVHRALTGQGADTQVQATEADLLPGPETEKLRSEAATELIRLLREADAQAGAWLRLIRAESRFAGAESSGDFLEFNEAESALALFLLDNRSIRHLLQSRRRRLRLRKRSI
jgi:hypothetical protein